MMASYVSILIRKVGYPQKSPTFWGQVRGRKVSLRVKGLRCRQSVQGLG